ncbi:HsdM family class I SAM-dependent methyltransferase [Dyadobacter sandarakinus]|uniref:site-specific DNA-methyltransferase (adenine-specific) n=1 Tax=Dyadobacter sandarakinus TaxID=2747268 RepID=A0ABX7I4A4_9BACT|nr:N-6 DNA methylase [Dyadobacter sandarakinus]QRR00342.1 N-6 DNA methylase [Dyadobacter sandarakinus]
MASQTRTYEKKKLLGQIYTPPFIVEKILRDAGFYDHYRSGFRVLDPACGDGRFLVPVARHIIDCSSSETLLQNLEGLHGWDIDADAIEACRKNLDALVAPLGITVKWNLQKRDALKRVRSRERFDLITGNPPYIRIQHLPEAQRKYIQQHYKFCRSGSTDAYIAFFELSAKLLSDNGVCALITPNSYFRSETGKPLRAFFYERQNLLQLTDYGTFSVFGNAATYSAVTIFSKYRSPHFRFEQCVDSAFNCISRLASPDELPESGNWHFSVVAQTRETGVRLGDICRISVGLVTLADAHFIFRIIHEKEALVYAESKDGATVYLEKTMLRPVIKGSKLKSAQDSVVEYILFPYRKDESGKHRIIPEPVMQQEFPHTYAYLLKVKPDLNRRDNGKPNPAAWYAFGRAQGLDQTFGKKIIFSPINRQPNFVLYENPDVTVYSGYFIKYDGNYEALLAHLNSDKMADFIAVAGKDFQGGYKGYNKKIIENFMLPVNPG